MPQRNACNQIHLQLLSGIPGDLLTEPGSRRVPQPVGQLRLAGTFFKLDSCLADYGCGGTGS
jgi:hypothetical protein